MPRHGYGEMRGRSGDTAEGCGWCFSMRLAIWEGSENPGKGMEQVTVVTQVTAELNFGFSFCLSLSLVQGGVNTSTGEQKLQITKLRKRLRLLLSAPRVKGPRKMRFNKEGTSGVVCSLEWGLGRFNAL